MPGSARHRVPHSNRALVALHDDDDDDGEVVFDAAELPTRTQIRTLQVQVDTLQHGLEGVVRGIRRQNNDMMNTAEGRMVARHDEAMINAQRTIANQQQIIADQQQGEANQANQLWTLQIIFALLVVYLAFIFYYRVLA
ncbi:hypothetical protein F5Y18DRAFT_428244 [Xylariaceae sp. FL1019]|nr:hypothetical protein F5Y18DRAFT_428244 [Xylariaceae sp. FL1019]